MTALPFAFALGVMMAVALFGAAVMSACHQHFPTWTYAECLQPVAERIAQ
jgi:hypothetical protein